MPIDPIIGGAIASGVGSTINSIGQIGQNKKSRQWAEDMYRAQRQDALFDFDLQNKYNSPVQQMARLKEAGLNPALMYGKSASPGIAGQVKSQDLKSPEFQNPEWGGSLKAIPEMFDTRVKQAQANNIEQQKTIGIQQALLLAAQTRKTTTDAEISEATKSIAIDAADAELSKTRADTKMTLDENQRRAMLAGATLQEKLQNVVSAKIRDAKSQEEKQNLIEMRKVIEQDVKLKKQEYQLAKSNIYKKRLTFSQVDRTTT